VVYFFVFESENLTLEAVDEMYRTKDLKPWKSSSWVPAGWHDRNNRMDADMADDVTRVGSEDLGRKSYKTNHAQIEKAGTPPQHA
jgi:SP family sugar:H+ symporter-like MFS transporter